MEAHEVYQKYVALKLHFNDEKYDYFKFGGKTKNTGKVQYRKRHDRAAFERLIKTVPPKQMEEFIGVSLFSDPKLWIGDIFRRKSELYRPRIRILIGLERFFEEDIFLIRSYMDHHDMNFGGMLSCSKGCHAKLFQLYLSKKIHPETLALIHYFTSCLSVIQTQERILFPRESLRIRRYIPFVLPVDKNRFRDILLSNLLTF